MSPSAIVQKLWNYCDVLRDDGMSYGDYVEQLTYLLFLKMADERTKPPYNQPSQIPDKYSWPSLLKKDTLARSRQSVQASQLMDFREKFRVRLRDKPKALVLLDELFVNPYMYVSKAERVLNVSNPTARQAVALLQKEGILKEITGRAWGRLYLAKPIMNILDPPASEA